MVEQITNFSKFSQSLNESEKMYLFRMMCPICDQIMQDPQQCGKCLKGYCMTCAQKQVDEGKQCFVCKQELAYISPSSDFIMLLLFIKFKKCPFFVNGCTAINAKYDHIKVCTYQDEQAQKGNCDKCHQEIFMKDLQLHYETDCNESIQICGNCFKPYNKYKQQEHLADSNCVMKLRQDCDQFVKKAADYNVILLGDSGVGKTSLLKAYEMGSFNPNVVASIRAENYLTEIKILEEIKKICFWSIAGSRQMQLFNQNYYKNQDVVFIVYDITDEQSFENMSYWLKEIKDHFFPEVTKIAIIANKSDLNDYRKVSLSKVQDFILQTQFPHIELSAKLNPKEVAKIFNDQLNLLYKKDLLQRISTQKRNSMQTEMISNIYGSQTTFKSTKQSISHGDQIYQPTQSGCCGSNSKLSPKHSSGKQSFSKKFFKSKNDENDKSKKNNSQVKKTK